MRRSGRPSRDDAVRPGWPRHDGVALIKQGERHRGVALIKQGETNRPEVSCPSVGQEATAKVITKRSRCG
ncbi:hypothetical protein [Nonomuraea aurantiaca]|uniref:hypothetical protein n=1 Tax=Nonomuraea aurantiaca TaxID=2878562 RepID=UPI001CDA3DA6|nr:hypothetical protein [Nonomuraea aurantiaca]MCA2227962.1 hypothetical protein [Nonomuraea aurantiaca]